MIDRQKHFFEKIDEFHSDIVKSVDGFTDNIEVSGREETVEAVENIRSKCRALSSLLLPADHPNWLDGLIENSNEIRYPLSSYLVNGGGGFDTSYGEYRDASGISEMFDSLIDSIAAIIALDVIESKTVLDALAKLKATLALNRKGSQLAILTTIDYVGFVVGTLKGYGEKIGGPAIKSFNEQYLSLIHI